MKSKNILLGILALSLVITMTAIGCDNAPTDNNNNTPQPIKFVSSDSSGNTYTLTITPETANTVATDDSYELTITNGSSSQVSKGTITNIANGVLTMKPKNEGSQTFTVTMTGQDMTAINGTITVGEGEGQTVTAPGTVTPGSNSDGSDDVTIDGWTWKKPYTDNPEGGTSTITRTRGSGNDSNKLTFSGNVQLIPEKTWGYAGCHVEPNNANLTALKNADSFSFKCRGDGKQYLVYVDLSDVPSNNRYRKIFTASTTDNTITVQYSELVQGLGEVKTFNKSNIKGILFEVFAETTGEGQYNITLWDLKVGDQGGSGSGTGGSFTVTGIPSTYNGKWAFLTGSLTGGVITDSMLYGFQTFNTSTGAFTLSQISNGSVSIPVWVTSSGENLVKYSGNGTGGCVVGIVDIGSGNFNEGEAQPVAQRLFSSVSFANGGATRGWSQGQDYQQP